MITFLAASLFVLTTQKFDLSVNVAPGDAISGIRNFRVNVVSDDPVTQVEFYVGSELRDSDSSIPYEFNLDTIEEKDGDLQLTFAAYTSKGDSTKKEITVKVDNGLALGPGPHDDKGVQYLEDSRWDDAILEARIALKASPSDNRARMIMARAFLGKGQLDKAEKYAEDWQQAEPDSLDANQLVAGIDLHRAFDTYSRGSDRTAALKSIQSAFKSAINTRQKALEDKLYKIGQPTDSNLIEYADAAITAGRYSLAINALEPAWRSHVERNDVTNRLAFAQIESGRMEDAIMTLNQVEKLAKLDAYGKALMAVAQAISNNQVAANNYIASAIQLDGGNLGVRTAQAFLALHAADTASLSKLAADLAKDAGDKPEVNYYLSALADAQGNFDQGREYFETAVYAEPLSEAAYLEEGNNSLYFAVNVNGTDDDKKFRAQSAMAMYQTALEVRPESYRALDGLALVSLLLGNNADALKYARAAAKIAPTQPSAHFTYAAALRINGMHPEASAENHLAWKYDPKILGGRATPDFNEAFLYFYKFDRMPAIAPVR